MLSADDLGVTRPGKVLLADISMALHPGELLMVLGPNGAGKSTLLKCLSGALQPDVGQVALDGVMLPEWPLQELARKRAVLTQQVHIPFALQVQEVVQLGLTPWQLSARQRQQLTEAALADVGLGDMHRRNYLQLSGGEQQRVQVARMLVQLRADGGSLQGRYLLLDEPLAALDLLHQQKVLRLLQRLRDQGLGILCVIHDVNLAALYGDRLLLLQQGRMRYMGSAHGLLEGSHIETTYGADLIALRHPEAGVPQWWFRG
ncbi:heme ABC transporter ATP-binding protein [Pokkaliibacter sp. MBI-7]|uniref:heme ABC transporter ATP-binding protein n=1 Tax=Pokkaliibacter sp. MBI-7 TaxID=3040600 RepID=UPI002446E1A2|nr:heme ABC transporter ATP-binding protein [Pokkaliibacter sp. MBI-7]MDH2435947.1 heme ABC transporter ATP-binding protein [Pokkaliibacter sp. MBI-7]